MGRTDGPTARPPLRRPAIVAAARRLIVEDGLDSLSFRTLAGRLGVSAPALYGHVSTKADLLAAVAAVEVEDLAARFDAVSDEHGAPADAARAMAAVYVAYSYEEPALFGLLGETPPAPRGSDAFAALERAVAGCGAADAPTLAAAVWAAAHGVAVVARVSGRTETEARRLLDALLDPLLSPASRGDRGSR